MYVEYNGSILQFIKQLITTYTLDNKFWFLYAFFACVIIICFLRSKNFRTIFVWPVVLFLVLVFNPVSFVVFDKLHIISSGRFYRFLWILPLAITISFLLTWITFKFKNKIAIICCVVAFSAILVFLGSYENTRSVYKKAENIYKIPNNIIELSEAVHDDYTGDTPVLYYNDWMLMYYRTYDANVISFRARGDDSSALSPEALQIYINAKDAKTILERVIIYDEKDTVSQEEFNEYAIDIDYIISEEFPDNRGYYEEAGWKYMGTFDGYELYKNPKYNTNN